MVALEAAIQRFVAFMQTKHTVLGAMLAGSYVRGDMSPRSDIDVFFLWADEAQSMRGRTFFEGVEFEYFFSPEWKYHERLEADPSAQQTYASGRIILDTQGMFGRIQQQAKLQVQQYAPVLSAQDRLDLSFQVETVWKDGLDLLDAGKPAAFRYLTGQNIPLLCAMAARVNGKYPIYGKRAMEQLNTLDPQLAQHVRDVLVAEAEEDLPRAWTALCRHVLALLGDLDISDYQSVRAIKKRGAAD